MARRFVTRCHRPRWYTYFAHLGRMSISHSLPVEGMKSLAFIASSATLGLLSSFAIPELDNRLDPWQWRVGLGVTAFVILQFFILTPLRMWTDATWVANIEVALDALWDLHDEGVLLLNEHHRYREANPGSLGEPGEQEVWFNQWREREDEWRTRLSKAIEEFAPPEARRLKNVITVDLTLPGINQPHTLHLNILRSRLERVSEMLARHHPSLLPE